METASRESDEKVERIQRKLDEAILQQQKDKKTNEERENDIRELKKALKLKSEELSAQHVCVGMVSMGNSGA